MKQPEGYIDKGFDGFMTSNGFDRCSFDPFMYIKLETRGCIVFLLLYIDDMLIGSKNSNDIHILKGLLSSKFDINDLGKATKNFGIKIKMNNNNNEVLIS